MSAIALLLKECLSWLIKVVTSPRNNIWLNVNRISLNINKTNYIIFHPFNKPLKPFKHQIQKTATSQKTCIKYFGVITLSWKQQIKNISCKISWVIDIMYKLSPFLNPTMLKDIYYRFIYSHIVYAIQVCGSAGKSETNKKLVLKNVPSLLFQITNPMFSKLEILKIKYIFTLQINKCIYKCFKSRYPRNFS